MAPRKKIAEVVNTSTEISNDEFSLLRDIIAATNNVGYGWYQPTGLENLVNNALIEINFNIVNPKNAKQFAVRSTNKGNDLVMAKKIVNAEVMSAPVVGFEVGAFNPAAVKPKAPAAKRGRESKYHLDRLEVGTFLFVPVNEKHADSDAVAKSLTGTVQAANKKFAEATGETKVVARKAKGSDEKIEKSVAVTRMTRKYAVYPYNNNGIDGAAIVREM